MTKAKRTAEKKPHYTTLKDWQDRANDERRSKNDKRSGDSMEYLSNGGKERRKLDERRQSGERRDKWLRVEKWKSVPVFDE
jgi:hypothetical protein